MTEKEKIYKLNRRVKELMKLGELPYATQEEIEKSLDAAFRINDKQINRYFYLLNLEDRNGLINDKYILGMTNVELVKKYNCSSNYINVKITKIFRYLITTENINYILEGGNENELFSGLGLDYHDRFYLFCNDINSISKLLYVINNDYLSQMDQIGNKSEKRILAAMEEYYKRKRD